MEYLKTTTFNNKEFGCVRMIEDQGRLLFCGIDVAAALGYSNPRDALRRHCKGVVKHDTLTAGGLQSLSFIPEGDVYRLIVHSRLPGAERFEKWVFEEVLPAIRKTGGYMTSSLLEQAAADPNVLLCFAGELLAEYEKNERLSGEVRRLEPKAAYYDHFIHPGDCTNIRATAKELGIGERPSAGFSWRRAFCTAVRPGTCSPTRSPPTKGCSR